MITGPHTASAAEDFLRAFHDRTPGKQSAGVEASPTVEGRTLPAPLNLDSAVEGVVNDFP